MSAGAGTASYKGQSIGYEPLRLLPDDVEIVWDYDYLSCMVIVSNGDRRAYDRVYRNQFVAHQEELLRVTVEHLRRVVAHDTL